MASVFSPHAEYTGVLQRKGALGMWSAKHVSLKGLDFKISDDKNAPPSTTIQLIEVKRGGSDGADPLAINVTGPAETVILRGADKQNTTFWYECCSAALICAGKARARNAGLPAVDPRFGLRFIDVPPEFAGKFVNLDKSVLYWFGAIKKYGAPSLLRKAPVEERIAFVSDKCFYVTKPTSEVTRVMKLNEIKKIFTNVGAPETTEAPWIVFRMAPSYEYDLHFSTPTAEKLIHVLNALLTYISRGKTPIPVETAKSAYDPSVSLQLSRPAEFEMSMVIPTTTESLKRGLDKFAAANNITFEARNPLALPKIPKEVLIDGVSAEVAAPQMEGAKQGKRDPAAATAQNQEEQQVPMTDVLGMFLTQIGLPQYYFKLYKNNVDIDVLECMDDADYKSFGVPDPKHVQLIRAKITNPDFMAEVRGMCDQARSGGKVSAPAPQPKAQPAAAAPSQGKPPIDLDDDDDLDIVLPPAKPKVEIILDDDDDDLLPPPKSSLPPIELDDDI